MSINLTLTLTLSLVQVAAMALLSSIKDDEISDALFSAGGCAALSGAMQAHPEAVELQTAAVSSLCGFGLRGGSGVGLILHSQAHTQVLAAMSRLSGEASIQEHGVALLHALASRSGTREEIATKGVTEAILSAMSQHLQHLGVQYHGAHAIAGLMKSPALQALRLEALQGIVTAMEGHAEELKLQSVGLLCVMGLSGEVRTSPFP